MTENQERAEQARSAFTVNGGNVQILPNATIAIQNIHWGDGTVTRTERWITPAESGLHESPRWRCSSRTRRPVLSTRPAYAPARTRSPFAKRY